MDFDREVGEAFDYQAATQALLEAVVVKAAEERNAAKRMAAEERGTRPRGWRRRQRGRQGRPAAKRQAGVRECKDCGGGGICEHGRVRSHCKACRCARAEADTQGKAAAALPRG